VVDDFNNFKAANFSLFSNYFDLCFYETSRQESGEKNFLSQNIEKSIKIKKITSGGSMNKSISNSLITLGCYTAVLTLALATQAIAQSKRSVNVKTEIAPVHQLSNFAIIPQAGASLSRNNEGVLGTISTSGLTPGHVITVWWSIFNNPEFCAQPICAPSDFNNPAVNGSLQFGGGTIADAGGRVNFSGYLAEGDNTGFYLNPAFPNLPNPAPGIVDTKKAQIHLAIRTHGMPNPDPVIFHQQLTSFPGGCSVAMPPCATVQAAPFLNN
jgi:hypothetical protein